MSSMLAMDSPVQRWAQSVENDDDLALSRRIWQAIRAEDWLEATRIADRYRGINAGDQFVVYSMTGRQDLVRAMWREGLAQEPLRCSDQDAVTLRDALDVLVEAATTYRLLVLQESHADARHRMLLHALLPHLGELGFEYLALEDLQGEPSAYETLSYPGEVPGNFYANEPVFGDVIRQAIRLGYRLVPFEARPPYPERVGQNEFEQWRSEAHADNLYRRIFAQDEEARVIVFSGGGHASKRPHPMNPERLPMAMGIAQRTGFDAFTVDQVAGCVLQGTRFSSGAAVPFDPDGAAVLAPVPHGYPEGSYDIQIRFESEALGSTGRPEWLRHLGRKPVAVPEVLRAAADRVVIEARLEAEPETAVPVDRLYLGKGESMHLMLPPGRYRVTAQTDDQATEVATVLVD